MQNNEIALDGGRSVAGVVRVGETVRRPLRARSAFVHALLARLDERGFEGAPRFLGIDAEGREILSYLEGWVPHEAFDWTDAQLVEILRLTRRLHDATAGSELAGASEV